jgi:beta-xylosidase
MRTDNDGNVAATAELTAELSPWQDPSRPAEERVADILGRMTLEEKIAQLYAIWVGMPEGDEDVAPFQHELVDDKLDWRQLITTGLGQLTRPFGSAPVDPALGALALVRMQTQIVSASRFGIPAVAHEECLTGFMTWGATVYPTPLAWGATFDPELVARMAGRIGADLRGLGIHQGLAPVLDVTRDPRWGRTEETIGEDPYLVATIGTAYVRGLESAGIVATLKHFAGYSASRAGRNFGPVAVGRRELADVLLLPFEMAIRDGGARSVMPSYTEIDGLPVAADPQLLTELLRETWGFTGTVVADYFEVTFLESLHGVAGDPADAARTALAAGLDVELPAVRCFGEPLVTAVRTGNVPESLIDRAAERVLRQKCDLGLLDVGWNPVPPALPDLALPETVDEPDTEDAVADRIRGTVDLDPDSARTMARQLAEESIVLLANDGVLPLRADAAVAVVGPLADDPYAMFGCYTYPSHVGRAHPDMSMGIETPTVLAALRDELPGARLVHAKGCEVSGTDTSGFDRAVEEAAAADLCIAVLGDVAGLFGQGTSGEGCDVADLALPGVQAELLDALLDTGTPVVLVLLTGRPYAIGAFADRLAAAVQAFFPGEEGGSAVAGVLSGRVCPSGRLPVGVPRERGGQPANYLVALLGHGTDVSTVDPTPLFAFGHGLSYTEFAWDDVRVDGGVVDPEVPVRVGTDGELALSLSVRNTGDRAGVEVVQLYLHDPVAQVTRPVARLIGYARVPLEPGESRRVTFGVHTDVTSFTGRAGHRVVEPGDLELRLGASSVDIRHVAPVRLVGPERTVDHHRKLTTDVTVQ